MFYFQEAQKNVFVLGKMLKTFSKNRIILKYEYLLLLLLSPINERVMRVSLSGK